MSRTSSTSPITHAFEAPGTRARRTPAFSPRSPTPLPLVCQRHAPATVRRHVARSLLRISVLLAADSVVLVALRGAIRSIRDHELLGAPLAELSAKMVPKGTYPELQMLAAVVLGLVLFRCYGQGDLRRDPRRLLAGGTLGLALMFWGHLWTAPSVSSAFGFAVTAATLGLGLLAGRWAVDLAVRRVRPEGREVARTLLVGPADAARRTIEQLSGRRRAQLHVVGFLTTDASVPPDALGGAGALVAQIREHSIDTLILSGSMSDDLFSTVIDIGATTGCQVLSLPRFFERDVDVVAPTLVWQSGVPLIQLTRPALRGQQLLLKRVIDLLGAGLGLVLLAPVLGAIAAAVRLSGPGPVLFRQTRIGRGGRPFQILKFRSMVADAERIRHTLDQHSIYGDERLFKVADDPRVTPLGRFLRRTSLDELPQLINVLRGEMSLVGPRPPLPSEVAHYEERHFARFYMAPGITGPWQVNGRNRIVDFEQVVRLEREYMRRWQLSADLRILLRTVPVVFSTEGAH